MSEKKTVQDDSREMKEEKTVQDDSREMKEEKTVQDDSREVKEEEKVQAEDDGEEKKLKPEDIVGAAAIKPPGWDRTGWEAFKYFLHDPEQGTILGRTPRSWLLISIFYLVFYVALMLFFFALLGIFIQTLPTMSEGPRYTVDSSFIGKKPGISSLPSYDGNSMLYSLMMFDNNTDTTYDDADGMRGKGGLNIDYAARVNQSFQIYNSTVTHADSSRGYLKFDLEKELGDCAKFPFGFISDHAATKPCIYLKLNNIWSWNPKPIDAEDLKDNPNWPQSLKTNFQKLTKAERQQIFVDCQGDTDSDREAITEGVTFMPKTKGFPIKYFPYKGNKAQFLPPLVALQFDGNKLMSFIEEMITVKCTAYFKGGTSEGDFRIRFQHKNFR